MAETGEGSAIKKTAEEMEKVSAEGLGIATKKLYDLMMSVTAFIKPFSQVQAEFEKFAKIVGMTGIGMQRMTERLVEQNRRLSLSMSYGVSNKEITELQSNIMKNVSRNITFDYAGIGKDNIDSELENIAASSRLIGSEKTAEMIGMFDKIGISMKTAAKTTGKLFAEAGRYGINLEKFSANFINNLEMAQTFTFSKGVDGLKEMARKATEIRQDMQQVASFANKVGSVTGAVETAANLQVLGGSFTALANPLAMLNESLTDMEGLQDRLISMTEGAARYNSTTRQIEMDPFTRMQMKRAAEVMGIDPKNLIDQAYAQARSEEIKRQMQGIGSLNEEFAKMLPNIGTIDTETGEAGVSIGNRFYTMSELAGMDPKEQAALQQQLVEETRSESDDVKAIAKSVMGIESKIKGRGEQMQNNAAYNNIRSGSINGTSIYDMVNDYIVKTLNPSTLKGAANLDHAAQSIVQSIDTMLTSYVSKLFRSFDADNMGDVNKKFAELLTEPLGEGAGSEAAQKFVKETMESLRKSIFDPVSDYIKEFGFDITPNFSDNNSGFAGRQGGGSASSGGSSRTLSLTAPTATNVTITPETVNLDIVPQTGGGQKIEFVYPAGSFPSSEGSTVRPPESTASSTGGASTVQETKVEHVHTFDGSFTLKVEGKDGPIGRVDILKWVNEDKDFRRELMHALSEPTK